MMFEAVYHINRFFSCFQGDLIKLVAKSKVLVEGEEADFECRYVGEEKGANLSWYLLSKPRVGHEDIRERKIVKIDSNFCRMLEMADGRCAGESRAHIQPSVVFLNPLSLSPSYLETVLQQTVTELTLR